MRLLVAAIIFLITAHPIFAKGKCKTGSPDVLTVTEWSAKTHMPEGLDDLIFITMVNSPDNAFRYIKGKVVFTDPFGDIIMIVDLDRTITGDKDAFVFSLLTAYNNKPIQTLTKMNPKDVRAVACVDNLVTKTGKIIDFTN